MVDYYSIKTKLVRIYFPSYASCRSATIISCILSMAWQTRCDFSTSRSPINSPNCFGTICPHIPYLSLHQPHKDSSPPRVWLVHCLAIPSISRLLSRLGWPGGRFNTELLGVLRVEPLPAAEFHRLAASDAADGDPAEKAIQNIETNVPPGSTH